MPKIKGYTNYRGRGPLWKLVLTVLALSVILASFAVLLIQRNLAPNGDGVPQIQLPWQDEAGDKPEASGAPDDGAEPASDGNPDTEPSGTTDADGETSAGAEGAAETEPETPPAPEESVVHVYPVRATPLSVATYDEIMYLLRRNSAYNAVSVRLKDTEGWVYFDSPNIIYTEVLKESKNIAADTTEALQKLTASDTHTIASIACFRDWRASNGNVRARLRNLSGRIFQDGNADFWIDPAREVARTYLCNLARDAAELGFDEILLTDACYPAVGRLDRILYGDLPKEENLGVFFSEMRKALEAFNVMLSVEVPKEILLDRETPHPSGLSVDVIAPYVDRVYAKAEPSEIQGCADALAGVLTFVPELSELPSPAPARYVYAS
ncbi:MAG: hypothetical protein IKN96_03665 [Oscillibacter sp.]|nr:hypothetical protein [Oscillibacter sp.]